MKIMTVLVVSSSVGCNYLSVRVQSLTVYFPPDLVSMRHTDNRYRDCIHKTMAHLRSDAATRDVPRPPIREEFVKSMAHLRRLRSDAATRTKLKSVTEELLNLKAKIDSVSEEQLNSRTELESVTDEQFKVLVSR